MSDLYQVFLYLRQIKNKEVSFQYLMNKGLKQTKEDDEYIIRDSLKSIVNRYYFLLWEQNKICTIEDEALRDYFVCALGQYHYVKEITEDKLLEKMNEDCTQMNPSFNPSTFMDAIRTLGGTPYPISDKENSILVKRLAINYAYPEWVVKMISKQFSVKHAYKSIASSRKSIKITLNCNTFLTDADTIASKENSPFEKGKLTENVLRYTSKGRIIDEPEFVKNLVFVEDEISQFLVKKLELEPGDETLLYADDKGSIALDMAMRQRDVGTIHVCARNILNLKSTRNLSSKFKIHSLDLFESTMDLLLTHIGNETCDKILFIPESSNLGSIRRKPAALIALKRDELDSIIANEKKELEEVSKFLKPGGSLVYAVLTYNKKESTQVIEEFLKNHEDYLLVEEKQIFAYEIPSDGVYYAVLKKKNND